MINIFWTKTKYIKLLELFEIIIFLFIIYIGTDPIKSKFELLIAIRKMYFGYFWIDVRVTLMNILLAALSFTRFLTC